MALNAGELTLTLEFAKDLKDSDWFGKQDPYAVVKVGGQTYRSRTATDGGRNPVWNQTFNFNVINENTVEISLFDEDNASRDDPLGTATISLAKVRTNGTDRVQAHVVRKSGKQRGFVSATLKFTSNDSIRAGAGQQMHQPMMTYVQQPMMQQPVVYGQPQQPMVYGQQPQQPMMYMQQPQQQAVYYVANAAPVVYGQYRQ